MGSRATADRRVMTDVLGALPKGMYFIDSKTTGNSIAGSLARSMRVKTASRNVFLDDVQDVVAIRRQLAELAHDRRLARRRGRHRPHVPVDDPGADRGRAEAARRGIPFRARERGGASDAHR